MPVSSDLPRIKLMIQQRRFRNALDLLLEFQEKTELNPEEDLLCILYEASIQNHLKDFEEAQVSGQKALNLSHHLDLPLYTIDALINLTISDIALNGNEASEKRITECDQILQKIPDERGNEKLERKASIVKLHGVFNFLHGNLEETIKAYTETLPILEQLNLQFDLVEILNDLGESHRLLGNLDQALDLYERGFQLAKEIRYSLTLPYFASNIGEIYRVRGNLSKALIYFEQGLQYAEILGNDKYFVIDYSAIGNVYWQQGHTEKALQFLNQTLESCEDFGCYTNAPMILFTILQIHIAENMLDKLPQDLEQMKAIYDASNMESTKIRYKLAQAMVLKTSLRAQKRIDAEKILKEIIEGDVVEHEITVLALINLCDLLLIELRLTNDLDVIPEIEPYLVKLIDIAKNQHSYWLISEIYLLQAKLALIRLDITEARRFLTQAQLLADDHGFTQLAQRISNEHDAILSQFSTMDNMNEQFLNISERLQIARLDKELNTVLNQSAEQNGKIETEEPMLIASISPNGSPIFYQSFTPDWEVDETLFSAFLTAFNSFSDELFAESLDRANFGQYTILMKIVETIKLVYVFKGPSYRAQQKFNLFLEKLDENSELWRTVISFSQNSQFLNLTEIPSMEALIRETIIQE